MDFSPLSKAIPSFGATTLEGFDTSNIRDGQRLRGSARQMVRFYKKKVVTVKATEVSVNEKTGSVKVLKSEPVEEEREFVQIVTPGDKNTVDDFVQEFHKREFWNQYVAFRNGKSAPLGMPIEECNFINANLVTELKYLGVHTAEQLADSSDDLCNQVANGWELREFARAICKANQTPQSDGRVTILKAELEKSQGVIAEMQKQMSEMRGMLLNARGEVVQAQEKRGPGRPASVKNEVA